MELINKKDIEYVEYSLSWFDRACIWGTTIVLLIGTVIGVSVL